MCAYAARAHNVVLPPPSSRMRVPDADRSVGRIVPNSGSLGDGFPQEGQLWNSQSISPPQIAKSRSKVTLPAGDGDARTAHTPRTHDYSLIFVVAGALTAHHK